MNNWMNSQRSTSVLWFLGGCLFLIEAALGIVFVKIQNPGFIEILMAFVYSLSGLLFILGALLYMFRLNPEYLFAGAAQVSELLNHKLLSKLAQDNSPELFKVVMQNMKRTKVDSKNVETTVDSAPVSTASFEKDVEENELSEIEKQLAALSGESPQ